MDILWELGINVLGGLVGAGIILWAVESRRKPRLTFEIETPFRLNDKQTHLRLFVRNEKMPGILRWVYDRETAEMCYAEISFHHTDGRYYFNREMQGRWSGNSEPVKPISVDRNG